MEKLECAQCGNELTKGVAACGACGAEVSDHEAKAADAAPAPAELQPGPSGNRLFAVLAVLLVLVGGVALLIFTGLLPNPLKGGGQAAAIVNGEKIMNAELDQKMEIYARMAGRGGQPDVSTPEGKAAAADIRMQILNTMIQEKILMTEAARENITVPPQEVTDRVAAVKKNLNLSDQDFDLFLKNHGMTLASFEKRIEKDLLIAKLIAKGMQEKGMTKDAWISELSSRAKVEVLTK